MFKLKGKVALITGGVAGIGLAVAKDLLCNGLKAVALLDINENLGKQVSEELKEKYKDSEILFVKANIRDKNSFEDAFKITVETFKHLDIVVNNAGILKDKLVEDEISINHLGTTYGCLLAMENYLPKYKSGDEAVILNIASTAGLIPCYPMPIYASTKWAIIGLTRALGTAQHYERTKVKVLAMCPGFTDTVLLSIGENTLLSADHKKLFEVMVGQSILQPTSFVGKFSSLIISEGNNGSVWVVTDGKPAYEHEFAELPEPEIS